MLSHERVDLVAPCFHDGPSLTHGEIVPAHSMQTEVRAVGTIPAGSKAVSSSPRLAQWMCRVRTPALAGVLSFTAVGTMQSSFIVREASRQSRHVADRDRPDLFGIDSLIVMGQHDA